MTVPCGDRRTGRKAHATRRIPLLDVSGHGDRIPAVRLARPPADCGKGTDGMRNHGALPM
jgi:hypothetical protein